MADKRTDKEKTEDAVNTLQELKKIRQPYESTIDEIIEFVDPSRNTVTPVRQGSKKGLKIYDGTALSALNLLVDGMVGYLCSRNLRWFKFAVPAKYNFRNGQSRRLDEVHEVRVWLDECEDGIYAALARSNFYDVVTEFIRDGGSIGTAHIDAEEEVGQGRITFTVPHFRECWIAENRFGKVDTRYRVRELTLRQLVDKFTMEKMKKIDGKFEEAFRKNPHEHREVLHAVYPRKDYDPERLNGASKPIASMWFLIEKEPQTNRNSPVNYNGSKSKLIEENGYNKLPSVTWRWRKNSCEIYGFSPAWDALVDIGLANQQGRTNLVAGHKMVDPPMAASEDLRGKYRNSPGSVTWLPTNIGNVKDNMPVPMNQGIQLPFGVELQAATQKAVRDHFAVDFFMMLTMASQDKVEMTATQVIEMMGEKAAILGTRVGMLQSEALDPIHDRVFDIEMRAGRLPEPPDILYEVAGAEIDIDYLGPLAQAQMMHNKTRSIRAGMMSLRELAEIDPTAMDVVDMDKTAREIIDGTGFPASCIRPDEDIAAIREQRMEAQQAQQMMEAAPELAKAGRMASFAPEEGSPMDQMMKGGE